MIKGNNRQKDFIKDFISAEEQLFQYFNCEENFFIKPLPASKWSIKRDGDFSFLNYWTSDGKKKDAVIVKKGGEPMVFKTEKYTMVIGIDCVKIGFIFHNGNKRGSE